MLTTDTWSPRLIWVCDPKVSERATRQTQGASRIHAEAGRTARTGVPRHRRMGATHTRGLDRDNCLSSACTSSFLRAPANRCGVSRGVHPLQVRLADRQATEERSHTY